MFLIPAFDVGGAEGVVARTAIGLDGLRFEPVVAAFIRGTGRLLPECGKISTVVLGERRDSATLPWRLLSVLRKLRPDILLTYMFHANIAGRIVGRLSGVPIIVGSERVVGWESTSRILANRATVGMATAVTTNSQAGQRFWSDRLRLPAQDIRVLYNGVDLNRFSARMVVPGRPPRLGVLARLHQANGHSWLLNGLDQLRAADSRPWTCAFAGDGPEAPHLRQQVAQLQLTDRVVFQGHCDDAPAFLRSLDICIHPSLVSGMPNAVLEAMAAGLPVIATRVGGTPEAVEDGETGWLVTPGDAREFASRAVTLLENPELAASMGRRGRRRVEELFSLDATLRATNEMLNDLARSSLHLEYRPGRGWTTVT